MRHAVLLLLIALVLGGPAGCGEDVRAPALDSRTPPQIAPRFWAPTGWAWGALEISGAPPVRYGVGASHRPARAHLILLPAGDESAEVYFETARALIERDVVVWTLEPVGLGGSGRRAAPRDLPRGAPAGADARAVAALIAEVIRPSRAEVVVLAARGFSAATALQTAEGRDPRLDGLVLWAPQLPAAAPPLSTALTRIGLGGLRAEGGGWRRPEGDLSRRAALPAAWALSNPDLRLGGPSHGWTVAAAREAAQAIEPARLTRIAVPVLMAGDAQAAALCARTPGCRHRPTAEARPHLSGGPERAIWLEQLTEFVEARIAEARP